MPNLHCLQMPGGSMLAWTDRSWVEQMLPADSLKKRVVRCLSRFGILERLSRQFNGRLSLGGHHFLLDDLFSCLGPYAGVAHPVAIFANIRRNPERIYIWLRAGDTDLFLKVGTALDVGPFRNEFEIGRCVFVPPNYDVLRPIQTGRIEQFAFLLSEGMSLEMMKRRVRVSPHEVIDHIAEAGRQREGVFGGAVHCDLAGNNVFTSDGRILLVDWEFAALSGPDYCDLVGLTASMASSEPALHPDVETIRGLLARNAHCVVSSEEVVESLEFLAARGNEHAVHTLKHSVND